MSFLEAVTTYIQTAKIATLGTDMFPLEFPSEAPDDCMIVLDGISGLPPMQEVDIIHPGIQVIVRSKRYPTAMLKAESVYNLFHGAAKHNYYIGTFYVLRSRARQTPGGIGKDSQDRDEISVNFDFKIDKGR